MRRGAALDCGSKAAAFPGKRELAAPLSDNPPHTPNPVLSLRGCPRRCGQPSSYTREPNGHESTVTMLARQTEARSILGAMSEEPTCFRRVQLPAIVAAADQRSGSAACAAMDPTGVPSPLYVAYLNYCREIWKKSNTYAIIAKWKVRQLDEEILKHLRFVLINVRD